MSGSLVSETLLEELAQQGEAIYEDRLRERLEAEHNSEYVVIHVDNGDYAVAKSFTRANREMLAKYPADGRLFGRKIGPAPDQDFVSRLAILDVNPGRPK